MSDLSVLTPLEQKVLASYKELLHEGVLKPSLQQLAARAGVSYGFASESLSQLRACGLADDIDDVIAAEFHEIPDPPESVTGPIEERLAEERARKQRDVIDRPEAWTVPTVRANLR